MGQFAAPKSHVLLAEDEALTAMMLEDELAGAGYSVTSVGDGDAALAAARLSVPEAAVLDLNMPGICGLELVEALRNLAPDLPVLIITGDMAMGRAAAVTGAGGPLLKLLEKPFCPEEFQTALASLLAGRLPLGPGGP